MQLGRLRESDMSPRYDLEELVAKDRLSALVNTFVDVARLSGGIVRNPRPGESIPADRYEFGKWRLTPVVGYLRDRGAEEGGSRFCSMIRKLEEGDKRCMIADLQNAQSAYSKRNAVIYDCHTVGLKDMVAPIVVGGHHLANIYFGQVRPPELGFEDVWDRYSKDLRAKSSDSEENQTSKQDLQAAFEALWRVDELPVSMERAQCLLYQISSLLSRYAAASAAARLMRELSCELAYGLDLQRDMISILRRSSRLLRFTSGSILIQREGFLETQAYLYPEGLDSLEFSIDSDRGIAPYVYQTKQEIICNSRDEIDKKRIPNFAESRSQRGLQSLMAVPILVENQPVGVFEIGDKSKNTYNSHDLQLLKTLAQFAGMRFHATSQFRTLNMVLSTRGRERVLQAFNKAIPSLVHGTSCSIFLRRELSGPKGQAPGQSKPLSPEAHLVETSEFGRVTLERTYSPGEGFTGWVLQNSQPLRVDGGDKARTANLTRSVRTPTLAPKELRWLGKWRSQDDKNSKSYYVDRPFLAVPIVLNGDTLGVIRIPDAVPGRDFFTRADETTLLTCAQLLASALESDETAKTITEVNQRLRELKELQQPGRVERVLSEREAKYRRVATASVAVAAFMLLSGALFNSQGWPSWLYEVLWGALFLGMVPVFLKWLPK